MQFNFLGIPMVRSIGLLLIGLAFCSVYGCTAASPKRSTGSINRSALRQYLNSEDTEEARARSQNSDESFHTAGTDIAPPVDSIDSFIPSHSADQLATIKKPVRQQNPIVAIGFEVDRPNLLPAAENARPIQVNQQKNGQVDSTGSQVVNALYQTDRDRPEYVVQIQGKAETGNAQRPPGPLPVFPDQPILLDAPVITQAMRPPVDLPIITRPNGDQNQPSVDRPIVEAGPMAPPNYPDGPEARWQSELERLIIQLERDLTLQTPGARIANHAEQRRKEIQLRLLYLIARHPEQALTVIPSLPPAEQEYWQQMVWAITSSLDADEQYTPRERAAHTIPQVNTALRRLREQADLMIKNTAFCEEISYFGNYKRFPRDEFVPGQPVLLYAEIENFRSSPAANGEYHTSLRSTIEVQDGSGRTRWSKTFDATEDVCRNPRRDYFHNYQFSIPDSLRLGPHVLKLTVVDELSHKQSTSAVRFVVK